MDTRKNIYCNNGNALFLILIAVALFAALSYAITQSGRGGGNINKETTELQAAQLLNYVAAMRSTIQRMQITGTADDAFRFANDGWGHVSYGNTATTPENQVFVSTGGGMHFMRPDPAWLDSAYSASGEYGAFTYTGLVDIIGVGTDATPSSDSSVEMTMLMPYIRQDLCEAINRNLGIPSAPVPDEDDEFHIGAGTKRFGVGGDYFTGNHGHGSTIGDDNAALVGVDVGCARDPGSKYYFWAVLIAR